MSLTETDEQRAYSDGYCDGTTNGKRLAIDAIRTWISLDEGMISVIALRVKLDEMEKKK